MSEYDLQVGPQGEPVQRDKPARAGRGEASPPDPMTPGEGYRPESLAVLMDDLLSATWW